LQFAFLRATVALVDDGVVSAEHIDVVMRDGLAQRWSQAGPFTIAAMGAALFARVTAQIGPHLSTAQTPTGGVARRAFTQAEPERTRTQVPANFAANATQHRPAEPDSSFAPWNSACKLVTAPTTIPA
jgi:3-hydroxyacyl-CoA dehydrogenase